MVKLIYQNEFAGGHLTKNKEDSLFHINKELLSLVNGSNSYSLTEDIGNNLCRLHLSKCTEKGIDVETINKLFVSTANTIQGNIHGYEKKLDVLRECSIIGLLPYDIDKLNDYIAKQKENSYPLVRHSATYRNEYSPHYRILKKVYCEFIKVFCRIDELLNNQDKVIVAIDGRSSAGKSTLSSVISDVYDCNVFHMDDFFLTPKQKTHQRLNKPGGNVDYERFNSEVMLSFKDAGNFSYRRYDCKSGSFCNPIKVVPKKLNIVEGVYSMHPTLIDNYSLKIFMDIDDKAQSARILKRNGKYMHERFQNEWIP
jgi:hypothetical protein